MREFDIEIVTTLVMASTLMYIKSKELLPEYRCTMRRRKAKIPAGNSFASWWSTRNQGRRRQAGNAGAHAGKCYPRLPAKQEFEMPEDRGPGLKVSITI